MKALVTGGGGFLGRYVVEQLLDRGDAVTIFARNTYPELEARGVTGLRGDILDPESVHRACRDVDVVFHVAGKMGVWGTWDDFYGSNVVGTENVLAACQANGIGRLVFTGSTSSLFDGTAQEGVDESCTYPDRYSSFYAHTKGLAERKVLAANGERGLLTVSVRPHFLWGPRDGFILPRLLARARARKLFRVGPASVKKDVTYVEDAAYAHLLAADALRPGSPACGSPYYISQDEPVLFWSWVDSLLRDLDLPPIRVGIPLPIARTAGALLEMVYRTLHLKAEPMVTRFMAEQIGVSQYYDISRAKRELGYRPRFTMEQAREKTVAYLKATGF